jgi:UDP-glucose 4-epimerase
MTDHGQLAHSAPLDFTQAYAGARVLITGGLGFIGSNLALRLVDLGAAVTLVDSLIPAYGGNWFNIEPVRQRVHVNLADVRDAHAMNALVPGHDFLFNLAGQVSHLDSMSDPFTDLEINTRSQLSILEACRLHNPAIKIVYAGTRQQYGKPDYLPLDERHLQHPTDVNGVNKLAGEWYHIIYHQVYGLAASSLRLTNTYGPRQLLRHNRQGFVAWFVRLALEGRWPAPTRRPRGRFSTWAAWSRWPWATWRRCWSRSLDAARCAWRRGRRSGRKLILAMSFPVTAKSRLR